MSTLAKQLEPLEKGGILMKYFKSSYSLGYEFVQNELVRIFSFRENFRLSGFGTENIASLESLKSVLSILDFRLEVIMSL
jgi:hypothetical protein